MQALIFDLDGVLVSTDRFHYLAWKALSDSLGLAFDEQVNHRLRGVSRPESLALIYEHNGRLPPGPEEFAAQCAAKNDHYVRLVSAMTPADLLPGAVPLLQELRAADIPLAVSSVSKNVSLVLEKTALQPFFSAVVDGHAIIHSKPHPECFLRAAELLGIPPHRCLGLEDAPAGIAALHAAGMTPVSIGPTPLPPLPGTPPARHHAASLAELSLRTLRRIHQNP